MITLSREILNESDWLGGTFSRPMARIDLALLAEEGRLSVSVRELASRWKWSAPRVSRFLDKLSKDGVINIKRDTLHGAFALHLITVNSIDYNGCRYINDTLNVTLKDAKREGIKVEVPDPSKGKAQPIPAPLVNPFILSSVQRDWTRRDPLKIAQCKRQNLEAQLNEVAPDMPKEEKEKFIEWYAAYIPATGECRGERDDFWNTQQKAKDWMRKRQPFTEQKPKQPSRIEQYMGVTNNFKNLVNELFNPDSAGADNGSANTPDEQ